MPLLPPLAVEAPHLLQLSAARCLPIQCLPGSQGGGGGGGRALPAAAASRRHPRRRRCRLRCGTTGSSWAAGMLKLR